MTCDQGWDRNVPGTVVTPLPGTRQGLNRGWGKWGEGTERSLWDRTTRQPGLKELQPLAEVGGFSVGRGPRDEAPKGVGQDTPPGKG